MENDRPSGAADGPLVDYRRTRELAEDIVSRSTRLHAELSRLQHMFSLQAKGHLPGLNPLIHGVEVEQAAARRALDGLERVPPNTDGGADGLARIRNRLTFSNLDAMERDWDIIKRCSALVSIGQEFTKRSHRNLQPKAGSSQRPREIAFADAAVDGGTEWLRIINTTEKRLLHQMAEEGWDWGEEDGSDCEPPELDYRGSGSLGVERDLEGGISLVRIIKGLVEASHATRCKYRHPRLRVVLTRLDEGANVEIDKLITRLRGLGRGDVDVSIHCANSALMQTPPPPLEHALVALVQDDMSVLAKTVLIDTSVLIALASDVANSSLEVQPWHRSDLRAQISEEANGRNFMVLNACPVLRGRELACTRDAARHFCQIVSLIGSKTEVERARILFATPKADTDGGDLLERLRGLSVHALPSDLKLPIKIMGTAENFNVERLVANGRLPRSALEVDRDLLSLPANRSTFMYGWLTDFTVITSNATLATRLERLVEKHRGTDAEAGPRVFVFPFNRALTTKGSRRMAEEPTNRASEQDNS